MDVPRPVFFCAIEPESPADQKPLEDALALLVGCGKERGGAGRAKQGWVGHCQKGSFEVEVNVVCPPSWAAKF